MGVRFPVGMVVSLVWGAVSLACSDGSFEGPNRESSVESVGVEEQSLTLRGQGHLALGDSLAFGFDPLVGNAPPTQFVGYAEYLGRQLRTRLTNLACPGETSGSFLRRYATDNGCREFRANSELKTSYRGTQMEAAESFLKDNPDTVLVTIDLGGNDVLLANAKCKGEGTCLKRELPSVLSKVERNLESIYDRIEGTGFKGHLLALMVYSTNYNDSVTSSAMGALNEVVARTTRAHGGLLADGFEAFRREAASFQGDPCAAGLLIPLPDGGCDLHPSPLGGRILAKVMADALSNAPH